MSKLSQGRNEPFSCTCASGMGCEYHSRIWAKNHINKLMRVIEIQRTVLRETEMYLREFNRETGTSSYTKKHIKSLRDIVDVANSEADAILNGEKK